MIYFIADTHFGESNIIKYEKRPFASVTDMNNQIIDNWNKIVNNDDIVFHLGDVGTNLEPIKHLNGIKYLIRGNHDTKGNDIYKKYGFEKVYDYSIIYKDFWMLSHKPLYMNESMPYVNIFGHVHNNPIYKTYSKNHYCVSVERINYSPISFDDILATVKEE